MNKEEAYEKLRVRIITNRVAPGRDPQRKGFDGSACHRPFSVAAIRCVLGLIPFEGEIQLDGLDVARAGKEARSRIGFVPRS